MDVSTRFSTGAAVMYTNKNTAVNNSEAFWLKNCWLLSADQNDYAFDISIFTSVFESHRTFLRLVPPR